MQRHCSLFSADKESLTEERDSNWIIAFVVKNEKRGKSHFAREYTKRGKEGKGKRQNKEKSEGARQF